MTQATQSVSPSAALPPVNELMPAQAARIALDSKHPAKIALDKANKPARKPRKAQS